MRNSHIEESSLDKYLYTGKERDNESGLDYFGARYYDSRLGRWMSVDPLAEKYPGLSPYTYCINYPLGIVDPNGMEIINPYDKGTEEYDYIEKTIELLKQTKTGLALYNKIQRLKQKIIIRIGKVEGNDIHPGSFLRFNSHEFTGGTLTLDKKQTEDYGYIGKPALNMEYESGFATLGHEYEHVEQYYKNYEETVSFEGSTNDYNNQLENEAEQTELKIYNEAKENIKKLIYQKYNKQITLSNFNYALPINTKRK